MSKSPPHHPPLGAEPVATTARLRSRAPRSRLLVRLAAIAVGLVSVGLPASASAYGVPIRTAIDTSPAGGSYEQMVLSRTQASGAQLLKLAVDWNVIAPNDSLPGFEAANPDSPGYNWSELDRETADAVARGLTPFFTIVGAPRWGQLPAGSGETRPDPAQLATFASAVARRYDGSHDGLPWVRYYEVWNEPNASFFLQPQIAGSGYPAIETYRTMIDDFSAAVHGARAEDQVIAGALFPNGLRRRTVTAIAPLEFTRRLLCMSAGTHPRRVCSSTVNADVWSVHPYTTGGPSTQSVNPENVWIYNLGALTSLVKAAQSAGTLVSSQPVQTWVTEFGWASDPPAPRGVPMALQQRWVAEALYRAWRGGIAVFTWYALLDQPNATVPEQAGLYFSCAGGFSCDAPKPAQRSFRFPFVAFRSERDSALLWGRTPSGTPGRVRVQWLQAGRWRTLTVLLTDGDGIFTATRKLPRGLSPSNGVLRAVAGEASPQFSLHRPPNLIVTPFGS